MEIARVTGSSQEVRIVTVVVPTDGQLQIPGSFQSYARIICSVAEPTDVTEVLTDVGEPIQAIPEFGWIAWRYTSGGVRRYGNIVPVRLSEQLLASDQPQFEFDQLLVIPRLGVTMNVSLRRVAI